MSGGDGRKLLLELVVQTVGTIPVAVTDQLVEEVETVAWQLMTRQEMHYDLVSAFIKSMRGSDPNAAMYYLARMLEGGEDPKFIARRMLILASEDIGNAPNALLLATSCFQAVTMLGYPECMLTLSQTAIYLAASVKSNAAYTALQKPESWLRAR